MQSFDRIKKQLVLLLAGFLPFNYLRIQVYKSLLRYKIGNNVFIGRRCLINCKEVQIGNDVYLGRRNSFVCNKLVVGDSTSFIAGNVITGKGDFEIGNNSRVTYDHYFDVWNSIFIGDRTWVAGKSSQFWTHGSIHTKNNSKSLKILIGDNVYVGSNSNFAPGSHVANNILIGLGSVVNSNFNETFTIILGNPAVVVKKQIDWRQNW